MSAQPLSNSLVAQQAFRRYPTVLSEVDHVQLGMQAEAGPSRPHGWDQQDPEALIDDRDPE